MIRRLAWLASLLVLTFALVAGLALTQPDRFAIERSVEIATPAEEIFPLVEDLMQWPRWSPWEHLDPAVTRTFGNPFRGAGAIYIWSGNREIGEGRIRITSSRPPTAIYLLTETQRPWTARSRGEFRFEPTAVGTRVTWLVQGELPFTARVINLFADRISGLGDQLASGLDNLKREAQAGAARPGPG